MTIIGSATVYSIYTSQELFNGQVTIAISTDGKILVVGTLNFADNNLSVSGRLYADLSNISQGAATVLFLADVPDQVRILTLYGKLQMGFKNIQGQEVAFTVPGPAARRSRRRRSAGPADGATIAASALNGRGYIDVSYTVPTGQKLDDASITDLAPEFSDHRERPRHGHARLDAGAGADQRDDEHVPLLGHLAGHHERDHARRSPRATASPVTARGRSSTRPPANTLPNPTTAAAAFTNVDTSGLDTPYIDVGLAPTANQTVNLSTLGAGDIVFSQNGSTLPITVVGTPTQIPNTDVFRYYLSGTPPVGQSGIFPDGKIDVSFPAGRVERHGRAEHRRQRLVHRDRADRLRRRAVPGIERSTSPSRTATWISPAAATRRPDRTTSTSSTRRRPGRCSTTARSTPAPARR